MLVCWGARTAPQVAAEWACAAFSPQYGSQTVLKSYVGGSSPPRVLKTTAYPLTLIAKWFVELKK